jgi:hypothetical protein
MLGEFTPRNTYSKLIRTVSIDDLVKSGLGFTANPAQFCPMCGDRIGMHVLVLDGDIDDQQLREQLLTQPVVGTVENYDKPDLPFACATFGFGLRLQLN